jgi:hypothetical protein
MKVNKMLFVTVLSLAAFSAMSPTLFMANTNSRVSRTPAEVAKNKKVITLKTLNNLKKNLATLVADLKTQEELLDQKSTDVENQTSSEPELEFKNQFKIVAEKKEAIEKLKIEIENSEVKEISKEDSKEETDSEEKITCKAESKGEKLEASVADLLKDKESILKQIEGLKNENKELKSKLSETSETTETTVTTLTKKKKIAPVDDFSHLENNSTLLLMTQLTSMFTTQMQGQMQMQQQMMTLMTQMHNNMMPVENIYKPMPTLSEILDLRSRDIGVSSSQQGLNYYQNPYSMIPNLTPQQLPTQPDFGFSFSNPQIMPGYDFNQTSGNLPTPVRTELPVQTFSI